MLPRHFFSIILCGRYFDEKKKHTNKQRKERTMKRRKEVLGFTNLKQIRWYHWDQFEKKDTIADAILFSFYHVSYGKKFSKNCVLKCQALLVKCLRGKELNKIPTTKEQRFKVISNKAV